MKYKTLSLAALTVAVLAAAGTLSLADESCPDGVCSLADAPKKADSGQKKEAHHLSTLEMARAVGTQQAVILDARSGKYDNGERLPGARQLSPSASKEIIETILPNKSAAIITYCGSTKCPASKQLAARLRSLGYTNVREYPEGLAGWKAAGGEIHKAD